MLVLQLICTTYMGVCDAITFCCILWNICLIDIRLHFEIPLQSNYYFVITKSFRRISYLFYDSREKKTASITKILRLFFIFIFSEAKFCSVYSCHESCSYNGMNVHFAIVTRKKWNVSIFPRFTHGMNESIWMWSFVIVHVKCLNIFNGWCAMWKIFSTVKQTQSFFTLNEMHTTRYGSQIKL